jgi:hypothetical protein
MPTNAGVNQRLSELIAKIEIEQNRGKFSALVEELNHLLDSQPSDKKQPASPDIDDHVHLRHHQPSDNSPLVANEGNHGRAPDTFGRHGGRTT